MARIKGEEAVKSKLTTAIGGVICLFPNLVHAETFNRTVPPGRTTQVKIYRTWNPSDCSSAPGIVKVVTKPQHGKLASGSVSSTIPVNRLSGRNQCLGKPIVGFAVNYTPAPGYHGPDTFTIDVVYERHAPISDVYNVTVQ